MRNILLGLCLVLLVPLGATAQADPPRAEVFGGYSYFRANPDDVSLHGWNASVTGYLNDWFGIEGDFSGHYGSPSVFGFDIPVVDLSSHTFMVGPKLAYRSDRVTPFAHFLIGGARAATGSFGVTISDTALAAAVGGGLDINLNDRFAIRAIQADYLMTRFETGPNILFTGLDDRQDNLRISAGIVIRF
jgi:opacity protein-like surface antigen